MTCAWAKSLQFSLLLLSFNVISLNEENLNRVKDMILSPWSASLVQQSIYTAYRLVEKKTEGREKTAVTMRGKARWNSAFVEETAVMREEHS